jgi:acetyl-CoA carboxylase biotin carboxylase subunit
VLKRVLVANRGEIAVRIIRACREMDIETVAVYSTADRESLHVQLATRSVCIGGPRAQESYLCQENVLSAALATGCDAVHPGFGFLSENPDFARRVEEAGLIFIGPAPEVIEKMGQKSAARQLMMESGVPVVPGSQGTVETPEEASALAKELGYPVLIKASAGGGGRGMRRVDAPEDLAEAFATARAEAVACFGDGSMYLEKLILSPKHIEFQILADGQGHVIHLGERDCSIQRRNQKLMEESPSRALTPALREEMGAAAVRAARAAGYRSAGTVEFVLDREGRYYFIEMNTRIQVEHPVTEMVTGLDLVKEQLRVASGLPLSVTQEEVRFSGHAIECRINAEDPAKGFLPSPGKVEFLHLPGGCGVRVDTMLYPGYTTSPYYDSMVAKVIVHGATRLEAIRRMRRALEELMIRGFATNQELEYLILYHPEYLKGQYDTGFLERNLPGLLAERGEGNGHVF